MADLIPDLTGDKAVDGSFTLLPPGDYRMHIKSAESKAASTGAPMVVVQFIVTEGEWIGVGPSAENYVLNNTMGRGRLKHLLECCGLPPGGIPADRLVGHIVDVSVINETFVSNKTGKPMQSAKVSSVSKAEGAAPAGHGAAQPAGAAVPAPAPPQVATDVNLPF